MLVFTFPRPETALSFPAANATRHPVMLKVLEREWNSSPTSMAPGISRKLRGFFPPNAISVYAASWQTRTSFFRAKSTTSAKKLSFARTVVGLFG